MRRGDRAVSSGEVCSSKRVEAVNPVPKSHQGALTVDRWRRSSAPRRSGQLRRRSDLTSAASRVFVCATEIGATSPNLTYWLSPDRIYIQSRGGGEEGTEEKEGRTNREYPVADEIWSGSIPCVRRNCPWPKEWNKWRERDRELVRARVCEWVCVGVLYGCTLTQAHTKSDTSQSIVQPEVATFRHRGQLKSASIQSSLMHLH